MAFGQQAGPPATAKQISELLSLLQQAGHDDFRDARGPMGFTQRQAGGKFTRGEADAFIEQLQQEFDAATTDGPAPTGSPVGDAVAVPEPSAGPAHRAARPAAAPRPAAPLTVAQQALRRIPTDQLAAELQRRGWIVVEP
jgi:hypothetical protein